MFEGDLAAFFRFDHRIDLVDRRDNLAGNLVEIIFPAQARHPVDRLIAVAHVRGEISRRAAETGDHDIGPVLGLKRLSNRVPVIGVDHRQPLDLLRRAARIDDHRQKLPFAVPEETAADIVIFHPLDLAEVRPVGRAVHHGLAVFVNAAAVKRDHGVPQTVGELAADAPFPRPLNRRGDAVGQEPRRLGIHHHLARVDPFGKGIRPNARSDRGVGMGRGHEEIIFGVEFREDLGQLRDDRRAGIEANGAQIDRNENDLAERLLPVARLQGDHVGGDRRGGLAGDAGTELSLQKNRTVGGDVGRGGADVQFRAVGSGRGAKNTGKCQDPAFQHCFFLLSGYGVNGGFKIVYIFVTKHYSSNRALTASIVFSA